MYIKTLLGEGLVLMLFLFSNVIVIVIVIITSTCGLQVMSY